MALIRNASAEDPDTVHRVKEFSGRQYTTYCGEEIRLSSARPANRPGLYICPSCQRYYRINLGKIPAVAAAAKAAQ